MPVALFSFKKNPTGGIMFHGFLAPSEGIAEHMEKVHAAIDTQFGAALKAGETVEETIDVDTIPEFDEDSIGEWLDDLLGLEVEDEEAEELEEEEQNEPT